MTLCIYNNPNIRYRIEGFCFFFTNAWELLLKAKILRLKKTRPLFITKSKEIKKEGLYHLEIA